MGTYRFGLEDVKVAPWISEGNFGTAVDLDAAQLFSVALQVEEAELPGDNIIKDTHSKVKAASVSMRYGELSMSALSVMTGVAVDSSTPGQTEMTFGEETRPYFAICGKVQGTGAGGDTHVFLPKCKLKGDLSIKLEYGNYVVPEMTLQAIKDGTTYKIVKFIEHTTETDVAIPPA